MGKLKNSLDQQQKINDAVKNLFEYLKEDVSYAELIEQMVVAQNSILMLVTFYSESVARTEDVNELDSAAIQSFLYEVSEVYTKVLRPFAKQLGQVYGEQD